MRSGDVASHVLRTFVDLAIARSQCCFLLFLDLVKAFDYALRELLFGFSHDCKTREQQENVFKLLNVPQDVASHVMDWNAAHGPILESIGVDCKARELMKPLYTNPWSS